jgi:hypothetical protein
MVLSARFVAASGFMGIVRIQVPSKRARNSSEPHGPRHQAFGQPPSPPQSAWSDRVFDLNPAVGLNEVDQSADRCRRWVLCLKLVSTDATDYAALPRLQGPLCIVTTFAHTDAENIGLRDRDQAPRLG